MDHFNPLQSLPSHHSTPRDSRVDMFKCGFSRDSSFFVFKPGVSPFSSVPKGLFPITYISSSLKKKKGIVFAACNYIFKDIFRLQAKHTNCHHIYEYNSLSKIFISLICSWHEDFTSSYFLCFKTNGRIQGGHDFLSRVPLVGISRYKAIITYRKFTHPHTPTHP